MPGSGNNVIPIHPVTRAPIGLRPLMSGLRPYARFAGALGWLLIAYDLYELYQQLSALRRVENGQWTTEGTPCFSSNGLFGPNNGTNGANCGIPTGITRSVLFRYGGPVFHAASGQYYYYAGHLAGTPTWNATNVTGARGPYTRCFVGPVSRPLFPWENPFPDFMLPPFVVPWAPITLPIGVPTPRPVPTPYPFLPRLPQHDPWSDPHESPTRRYSPTPARPRTKPNPFVPYAPSVPDVAPVPGVGIAVPTAPGAAASAAAPSASATPRGFRPRRPPRNPREKERKYRGGAATVNSIMKAVAGVAYGATEVADAIDAIWDALPARVRAQYSRYGEPSNKWKAIAIYRNLNSLNVSEAMQNLVVNQIVDAVVGRVAGRANREATRRGIHGLGANFRPQPNIGG